MSAESSVEPSSTTMMRRGTSWVRALSRAVRMTWLPLYAGSTTSILAELDDKPDAPLMKAWRPRKGGQPNQDLWQLDTPQWSAPRLRRLHRCARQSHAPASPFHRSRCPTSPAAVGSHAQALPGCLE